MKNYESVVSSFYLAYYGRPADPAGLAFWSAQLERVNGDLGLITTAFANSDEAIVRFDTKTTAERIEDVYQILFNRKPDAAGLQFWTGAVDSGQTTLANVALEILHGAQGSDVVISNHRQDVASAFTSALAKSDAVFDSYPAIDVSRLLLAAAAPDIGKDKTALMIQKSLTLLEAGGNALAIVNALSPSAPLELLLDTDLGRADPYNLFNVVVDVGVAAQGKPASLDALLRGGGVGKMLEAMPKHVNLVDLSGAIGRGGLGAAVELVYPAPVPAPAPAMKFGVDAGILTLSGRSTAPATVDLTKKIIQFDDRVVDLGSGKIEKVVATGYAGKVALSGTIGELTLVASNSPGFDIRIVDSKNAVFAGAANERHLAPGTDSLLKLAKLISFKEPLSIKEYALLEALPEFNIGNLQSTVDRVAPVAGKLIFDGISFDGGGTIAFTNKTGFSLRTEDVESGATIALQSFNGQDGWVDLPSSTVSGLAAGDYKFRSVVTDAAGNVSHAEAQITIDMTPPAVGKLKFGLHAGSIAAGKTILLNVSFDGPVTASEGSKINFDNQGSAVYQSGNGTGVLVFGYTPVAGQDTALLKLDALVPFTGSIVDRAGNTLTLDAFADAVLDNVPDVDTAAPTQEISFAAISQSTGMSASVAGPEAALATNQDPATVYASMQGQLAPGEKVEYSLDGVSWSSQDVTVTENAIAVAGVATLGSPTIQLRVTDAAGNAGPVASRAIVHDTTAPEVGKVTFDKVSESPLDRTPDNVTDLGTASVTFQHDGAWLGVGDRLQYSTNGIDWTSLNMAANADTGLVVIGGVRLDQGMLRDDGSRATTVSVRALDAAGNATALGSQELVFDNRDSMPTLSLYSDTGEAGDRITSVGQVNVGNLSTAAGVTWSYSLNGGQWIPGGGIDSSGRASLEVMEDGLYTVRVRQQLGGATSADATFTFTRDTKAPEVSFAYVDGWVDQFNKVGPGRDKADVVFGYHGRGPGDKIEYRIDGGAWLGGDKIVLGVGEPTITIRDVPLAESDPKVELRVTDVAGNVSVPASVTVDGPFQKQVLVTEVTREGLKVTSPVGGSLYLINDGGATGINANGSSKVTADVAVVVGTQAQAKMGTLGVSIATGKYVLEEDGPLYYFGSPDWNRADVLLYEGNRDVVAWAFDGPDQFTTGAGNDKLFGSNRGNFLSAGAGDDYLFSGYGVNTLIGGAGADHIDITQGQNTLRFAPGDSSVANGIDVVTFAARKADNTLPQTFEFSPWAVSGRTVTNAAAPQDSSGEALLAAISAAFSVSASAAAVIAFANGDQYLFVDTGDGVVDQHDFVVKLVGELPPMQVLGGNPVFGNVV